MNHHSHCHACGVAYASDEWPRTCPGCGNMFWRNPIPVAVCLVPVVDEGTSEQQGLLLVERSIAPHGPALPGGFVDWGEDVATAAVRELREETGIVSEAADARLYDSRITLNGAHLLMFCVLPAITTSQVASAQPSDETAGVDIADSFDDLDRLVFDLHRDVAARWFGEQS